MECLKSQLLKSGGMYSSSWIERPNMTMPWPKQSQPILTDWLYVILKKTILHYKITFVIEKRGVSHEVAGGGWRRLRRALDGDAVDLGLSSWLRYWWRCDRVQITQSLLASALTRAAWKQALPRVSMRDSPPGFSLNQGGVEAGSAQGVYERLPSWLQP